ncbi:MAG TPA: metal ABC transporter ATP-binding protein [Microcoleaceae cyanobacterium]|jgi:zinc/manganese transport system ATP-binding protein
MSSESAFPDRDARPSHPETIPVVKVNHLTVRRGQHLILQDISFELLPGTSVAIVGPNGAGKSTLVQALLGLLPRTAGTIEIFGHPLARLGQLQQQIGYIPQNLLFDRNFPISVAEFVSLGWTPRQLSHHLPFLPNPERLTAVNAALRRMNILHLRRQAIGTLSGGELKRMLLAYCLVSPRRLLVLDEAFAEVDVQGEAEFQELLKQLMWEEGWTVVQVSHDLDMVTQTCNHVLCINRSLICSGSPTDALSPDYLVATYGDNFQRYHHHH